MLNKNFAGLSNLFENFITVPSSVNNLVSNIKGNNPGKTEKVKSFKPSMVPDVYLLGLDIIIIIIDNINNESKISKKVSFLMLDIFKDLFK